MMMSKYYLTDPFATLDKMFASTNTAVRPTYPPYNVVKIDDDKFVMEFAAAGFTKEDIDISAVDGIITIKGEKKDEEKDYLHKGIASRKFIRSFTLPEYFEVDRAGMENGILYIDLIRNLPEEKKPKKISIQ
jgi:molecular chaperone IbpA